MYNKVEKQKNIKDEYLEISTKIEDKVITNIQIALSLVESINDITELNSSIYEGKGIINDLLFKISNIAFCIRDILKKSMDNAEDSMRKIDEINGL